MARLRRSSAVKMRIPFLLIGISLGISAGVAASTRPGGPAQRTAPPRRLDWLRRCQATNPVAYGRCYLRHVQAAVGSVSHVRILLSANPRAQAALDAAGVTLDQRPESFEIVPGESRSTIVIGRDAAGALYGALELADRLQLSGPGFLPVTDPFGRAPAASVRAANLFLVLPADGESTWWFLDQGFWNEYLDLLPQSRLNFLDLHGMYTLDNRYFPNRRL